MQQLWWLSALFQNKFETLELQQLFKKYLQKINHGYFSQFLTLQILLITSHFIVLLSVVPNVRSNRFYATHSHDFFSQVDKIDVLPDLILYGLVATLSIVVLVVVETYVKTYPNLLNFLEGVTFVAIFFTNAFLPFYNKDNGLRPAYTPFLIISTYIFLNIQKNLIVVVMGVVISVFHILVLVFVTYANTNTETLHTKVSKIIFWIVS